MKRAIIASMLLLALMGTAVAAEETKTGAGDKFTLSSTAFKNNGKMPARHKNNTDNISPALQWANPPANTKSFYIACEDLNVPWNHWVIYDIPASYTALPENIPPTKVWKDGIKQGVNSWGRIGWGGPQPPSGVHWYEFTIYALDVEKAESTDKGYIKKHTLGTAKLVGVSD
jgi:Raf kinase inhibitor-like YbhB/YbcL family protein